MGVEGLNDWLCGEKRKSYIITLLLSFSLTADKALSMTSTTFTLATLDIHTGIIDNIHCRAQIMSCCHYPVITWLDYEASALLHPSRTLALQFYIEYITKNGISLLNHIRVGVIGKLLQPRLRGTPFLITQGSKLSADTI